MKKIFTILAAEELTHYNALKTVKTGSTTALTDSGLLENVTNIFRSLQVDQSLLNDLRTNADVYNYAMKMEEESIGFYEHIAREETNPAVIQLLLQIVAGEKKHLVTLRKIHELLAGFESYHIWHKFVEPMDT